MGNDGNRKAGSTAVIVAVIVIAFFVNGKQLAGLATGSDQAAPAGCADQAQPGMDGFAEGDVDEQARQKAENSVPELSPDFTRDIVDGVVGDLEDVGIL